MSTNTTVLSAPKAQPLALSASDQIERIATAFSLEAAPNDLHGPQLRQQLLTSYIEWLDAEQRLATCELWPQYADEAVIVPMNTRWGKWHWGRNRFPGANWTDFKHPLTRAAMVLWSVGAIDDLHDPLREALAAFDAGLARLNTVEDEEHNRLYSEIISPIYERLVQNTPTPTTMAGAAAGLRFVLRGFGEDGHSIADEAIVREVVKFLDREDPANVPPADPALYRTSTEQIDAMWRRWRELRNAHSASTKSDQAEAYKALTDVEDTMLSITGAGANEIGSRILLSLMIEESTGTPWPASSFPWPQQAYRGILADLRPQMSGVLRGFVEELFAAGDKPCRSLSFWR